MSYKKIFLFVLISCAFHIEKCWTTSLLKPSIATFKSTFFCNKKNFFIAFGLTTIHLLSEKMIRNYLFNSIIKNNSALPYKYEDISAHIKELYSKIDSFLKEELKERKTEDLLQNGNISPNILLALPSLISKRTHEHSEKLYKDLRNIIQAASQIHHYPNSNILKLHEDVRKELNTLNTTLLIKLKNLIQGEPCNISPEQNHNDYVFSYIKKIEAFNQTELYCNILKLPPLPEPAPIFHNLPFSIGECLSQTFKFILEKKIYALISKSVHSSNAPSLTFLEKKLESSFFLKQLEEKTQILSFLEKCGPIAVAALTFYRQYHSWLPHPEKIIYFHQKDKNLKKLDIFSRILAILPLYVELFFENWTEKRV